MNTWDEARWLADNDLKQGEKPMNDNTETKVTGRDLEQRGLEALDVTHYDQMPVENIAKPGEISGVDWLKVFELGKALAAMKDGMPQHVRGAWGIGCRIAANAFNWKMDPFAIADQTYVVNNRLGYMSQLIHALINRNAPLMHRLECHYIGEGPDLQCRVVGQFISGDEREYITPKLKDIKVKNSPLWTNDAPQQLWYFGVRSWGRKWVPEVMLGVYTKEELEADPSLGYEESTPGLHARLKGSAPSDEGHEPTHVAAQLEKMTNGKPAPKAKESAKAPPKAKEASTKDKRTTGHAKKPATAPKVEEVTSRHEVTAVAYPSTVAEYLAYARRWLKTETNKVEIGQRWANERKMRNALGVTSEDRAPLEELMQKRISDK